jgi:hypothetical protein
MGFGAAALCSAISLRRAQFVQVLVGRPAHFGHKALIPLKFDEAPLAPISPRVI